uniref:DNA-directed RNA polymerase n=1 Tax=Cryptomonas sp. CCAC 1634B TaxID=2051848 RepID=A0A679CB85_9CRYP|nr:RNA polymerase b''-subunit [Cryptomonas sp. CCAC 1634B]
MKETSSNTSLEPNFINKVIDKKELKLLMGRIFNIYGAGRASHASDRLKELGFHYATRAGISLSIEDLRVPSSKRSLLSKTDAEIQRIEQRYRCGDITFIERFQKVIDTWNNSSESLKDEVIAYFKIKDPLNPVYMMAFSGARGNLSQVKQLVGMRGLMADPHGQIISLPIKSNFREGLTVTEYVISCYGARKGLVDTALRTADSGYLTRRLVDVAQDILIREVDCGTMQGILLKDAVDKKKILISLESRLSGRVLQESLYVPDSGEVIARINQSLNRKISVCLVEFGMKSIYVRSPLTCESSRSVCQLCYGWSLAHGSLVDLGEAVGIIAAQSIGEPGTQLTMRTFHTGGVFTGNLAEQIRAPFDGILKLPRFTKVTYIRTQYGGEAFRIEESLKLDLCKSGCVNSKLELKQGTTLFISDNEEFRATQVIGELSARENSVTEKASEELYTDISGESFFSELSVENTVDRHGNVLLTSSDGGLLWVLAGDVYSLPKNATVHVTDGTVVTKNSILASVEVLSNCGGKVRLVPTCSDEVQVITASLCLHNGILKNEPYSTLSGSIWSLEFEDGHKFSMHCSPGNRLSHSQTVAESFDHAYCTTTGGILRYSTRNNCKPVEHGKGFEVLEDFSLFWIPEETHHIHRDASLLMVHNGEFVNKGSQLIADVCCVSDGYVEILEENGVVTEISIKPGILHPVEESVLTSFESGIFYIGDKVYNNVYADNLSFIEITTNRNGVFLLIRPIIQYFVHKNTRTLQQSVDSTSCTSLRIRAVERILFKDGEKVKSASSVVLLKTYLVLDVISEAPHVAADVEFLYHDDVCRLNFVVLENLRVKKDIFGYMYNTYVHLSVDDGDCITPGTKVAEIALLCRSGGEVRRISDDRSTKKVLILTPEDLVVIPIDNVPAQVSVGECVQYGDHLTEEVVAPRSGQVFSVDSKSITVRFGTPYLLSPGAILQIVSSGLVQKGDVLATLAYERSKIGDIVQGLPRIEEILEARKPKDSCVLAQRPGTFVFYCSSDDTYTIKIFENDTSSSDYIVSSFQKFIVSNGDFLPLGTPITAGIPNPHEMLHVFFNFYKCTLNLYEAAKLSLQKVQMYLVHEVQSVYQSQHVDISDKHLEVVIRQMTSKVRVEDGGDTTLLPGELVELQQIETVNKAMSMTGGLSATYYPVLLGITKSSLNADSFISAASFQETTRVLAEAAIEGRTDWLQGLKENVIIGRLIPAGTGFSSYRDLMETE